MNIFYLKCINKSNQSKENICRNQQLTTCINTCDWSSNERGIANRSNSIPGIHSELVRFILAETRYSEAHLNYVCKVGLHPSAIWSIPPLHTVASDLAATIIWRSLPGQAY